MKFSFQSVIAGAVLVFATTGICRAQAPANAAPAVPDGYVGRTQNNTHGLAPTMKATELGPVRTFNLDFSRGDDPMAGLAEFAEVNHLTDCRFTAIGAFGSAVLGWYDPDKRAYKKIEIPGEAEVVAMAGSIRIQNGKPFVHAHAVVGLPDGTTRAGHIVDAKVSLSLEVYLTAGEAKSAK